jgi:hypothetical protein
MHIPTLRSNPGDNRETASPDLHTQLEELFSEVWAQESFEKAHPFTCATMREPVRRASRRARAAV